jgi:hypothetical protein
MADQPSLIDTAERIAEILSAEGVEAIVIGAAALAAHRYVRHTEDIDLGVNIPIRDLAPMAERIRSAGYEVAVREPDGEDPLGGVIDVIGPFGLVQIVNFGERFPAVIDTALTESPLPIRQGATLRIIPLANLVVLKLYAGGTKSKADIVELLRRNPDADRDRIRTLCRRYRMKGLQSLIREADNA